MRLTVAALAVLLTGCPEQRPPERGLQLVYRKPADSRDVRAVVDRRLARLKLRARLQEDETTLTVRLPEGADVGRVKQVLARRATLELCPEDEPAATTWCARAWPAEVRVERGERTCALAGPSRATLEGAVGDAGVSLAWSEDGQTVYAAREADCVAPHIVDAEPKDGAVLLEFDRASAAAFSELTTRAQHTRLLIRFEGTVRVAPLVLQPITGGRATITLGRDGADLDTLAALLVGGPLPGLVLEREGTWGPPSLR